MKQTILESHPQLSEYQIDSLNVIFNNILELETNHIPVVPFDYKYHSGKNELWLYRTNISGLITIIIGESNMTSYAFTPNTSKIIGKVTSEYHTFDRNFEVMVKCFLMDVKMVIPKLKRIDE